MITCLFCDLVGFTARAERMDPEDVRALLQPYHARVRSELERFGGTVEKFIGDAVMAVFGAPVAHEDDPERAVRAALSIRAMSSSGRGSVPSPNIICLKFWRNLFFCVLFSFPGNPFDIWVLLFGF